VIISLRSAATAAAACNFVVYWWSLSELRGLRGLNDSTGVSGEVSLMPKEAVVTL
jgi:hypothetical protein